MYAACTPHPDFPVRSKMRNWFVRASIPFVLSFTAVSADKATAQTVRPATLDTAPQRAVSLTQASSQSAESKDKDSAPDYKFSASTTWLSFDNFGEERTNTHHYELHVKYALTPKDRIGIKFATWSLFQPMGILWWDGVIEKARTGSERYPGRLRETGLGISYQRMLWRGLFSTVEVLPQIKTYSDEDNKRIGNGFKLYTSYHMGYHIPLFKNRVFLEPQIHSQYWPIDTKIPQGFKEQETKWKNYFLFEPNIYVGVKF